MEDEGSSWGGLASVGLALNTTQNIHTSVFLSVTVAQLRSGDFFLESTFSFNLKF